MRHNELRLRKAARDGNEEACLDIAAGYFQGTNGLQTNYPLGIETLGKMLQRGSIPAAVLVSDCVPLDVLINKKLQSVLRLAHSAGSPIAQFKLGLWLALTGSGAEGRELVRSADLLGIPLGANTLDTPSELAAVLKQVSEYVGDSLALALLGSQYALEQLNVKGACYCIKVANALADRHKDVLEIAASVVKLAARDGEVDLPKELVELSLSKLAQSGDVEAQFALGCALAGIPYGALRASQISRRTNFRKAAALLLRAADLGKRQAWLHLFEIMSDYHSSAANQEMARYFLEKAADNNVRDAQRILGVIVTREAATVDEAEVGVTWLHQAAKRGDDISAQLLRTMGPANTPMLTDSVMAGLIKVKAIDNELSATLALAHAFGLTRREAMGMDARSSVRPWGLKIKVGEGSKGRLITSVSEYMTSLLREALTSFCCPPGTMVPRAFFVQRARAQREVFKQLSLAEELFFTEELRRKPTFGRAWGKLANTIDPNVVAAPR